MPEKRVGIICGFGDFPSIVVRQYQKNGYQVFAVVLEGENHIGVAADANVAQVVPIEKVGRVIRFFRSHHVEELVFAGKVHKKVAFGKAITDFTALRLLGKMANYRDATMMEAIIAFLEQEGFTVAAQTRYLEPFLAPAGEICGRVTEDIRHEIAYGYQMARMMADHEIGQTVVVRKGSVVAVEALEGTDATIERAGTLVAGTIVVKAERPKQDNRFDTPAIGITTVQKAIDARCRAIGVEAGKIFLLQRPEIEALARKHKLVLYGYTP
ncbi:LpxI family protein [Chrysiogenes arsenatis]|uniref:LpxI family protein n=1 Tax=Chrysiogenes arsenatis TaxID=309797 RepID=UPI0004046267|nr:UDP-2,3-diacylglucosamine diphosphatase LpxI [Chrysiogenes arsenatis]